MDAAEVINSLVAAWNERDKGTFVNGYGDDCEITSPGGVVLRGREGVEAFWHGYQDAFPDNRIIVGTVFGTGGEAVEEAVFGGTHTGPLRGPDGQEIPATEQRVLRPSHRSSPSGTAGSHGRGCTSTRSTCCRSSA